jgi:hypothetical protein
VGKHFCSGNDTIRQLLSWDLICERAQLVGIAGTDGTEGDTSKRSIKLIGTR